ncbi:MAG: biopolymer transporter ExbD [Bacteroidia bacterium]|nr:biopolymer transporter ExbD [Bacteroidia bacterium]
MSKKELPEINAASMADMAFLLLVFFLFTTTIDSDKGLQILLPPKVENEQAVAHPKKRNVLNVLVNGRDQLLVRGEVIELKDLTELVKRHVGNFGADPNFSENPKKAIISIKNDRGTSYEMYIKVQNELKRGYNELRNEEAMAVYGRAYSDLNEAQQESISKKFPQKISEAEPENVFGEE